MKKINLGLILLSTLGIISLAYLYFPQNYFISLPDCSHRALFQDQYVSTSEDYQSEVLSIIENKNPNEFRYLFKTFLEEKGGTSMLINFRNGKHCFDAKILVDVWDKLGGMRKTNGKSYPKERYELEWKIETIDGDKRIVYQNMHRILD